MRLSLRRVTGSTLVAAASALASAATASGSSLVDRDAVRVRLSVTATAAQVSYTAGGKPKTVVARGAINAGVPAAGKKQDALQLAYGQTITGGSCGRYDGPRLPWFVAACKASDGSYWALQSFRQFLPNFGLPPANVDDAARALHISHWKGPLPVLTVKQDWAFKEFHHLYGSVTYSPKAGVARKTWSVPIYVDTFKSSYGSGWKREFSLLTHTGTGIFCYPFIPRGGRPPGRGARYRVTAVGPGALPDVLWQAKALGDYDPIVDEIANDDQRAHYSDDACRPN